LLIIILLELFKLLELIRILLKEVFLIFKLSTFKFPAIVRISLPIDDVPIPTFEDFVIDEKISTLPLYNS
jgi:hypothetical protein